jgi:hypothetical protein
MLWPNASNSAKTRVSKRDDSLSGAGQLDQQSQEYFRRREQTERTAADSASCDAARRVHERLAQGYAELLRKS